MKFTGTGKSSNNETIYQFVIGKEEAQLLHDIAKKFAQENKGITETTQAQSRATTIYKEIKSNAPIK